MVTGLVSASYSCLSVYIIYRKSVVTVGFQIGRRNFCRNNKTVIFTSEAGMEKNFLHR
jgi:hypothetical protein